MEGYRAWTIMRCPVCNAVRAVAEGPTVSAPCFCYARGTQYEVIEVVPAEQLAGAVDLSGEELHCLICAMAGNFPERFQPIRMGLLRKLAKAQRATGGR
jgi:hypothetical protein